MVIVSLNLCIFGFECFLVFDSVVSQMHLHNVFGYISCWMISVAGSANTISIKCSNLLAVGLPQGGSADVFPLKLNLFGDCFLYIFSFRYVLIWG